MDKKQSKTDDWGQGWDYLFKEIWSNMDQIREDNLNRKHNKENIEYCFKFLYSILIKSIIPKIKELNWPEQDKAEVINKTHKLIMLYNESKSFNDKVIAINMTEQFLRSIY